ncbi:MAG: glucosamine--fructose-6-phosphate aminotransferase [Gammaproteobacteria bacterium HGW-Gammaproteobacteria-1]|jgi:hypothetical protein|nr:MAG: glucosamine--fructose-6-phosphate aminotransferase [Gammaproteobacteria bacterium HGW-Gammaproteobacteria-1]
MSEKFPMILLPASVGAWGADAFSSTLKAELERLRSDVLPIAHAVGAGNRLDDSDLGIIVNEVRSDESRIYARVGVFFAEIIDCVTCGGGSGMRDEAYCELSVTIDRATGEAGFVPL